LRSGFLSRVTCSRCSFLLEGFLLGRLLLGRVTCQREEHLVQTRLAEGESRDADTRPRQLGDSVRYLVAGTVITVLGVILGYRPDAGVGGVILALALVIVFAFALSWVFTTIGLLMRSPNAVMNAGFMGIFPLTFLSNVFVEPETLPAALEAFVDVNPISILATASRGLMDGNADGGDILVVLGTAALLTAVFAPLTTHLYRRKT